MKKYSTQNKEIIVAFLDLIDTGIARGYTLQEFHDLIELELNPSTSGIECPNCGGNVRIGWANRFNACWNCDYTLKVEDIF